VIEDRPLDVGVSNDGLIGESVDRLVTQNYGLIGESVHQLIGW
jgi:hypothetical protein